MSEEDQRAQSAISELQTITPDSWQNIPQPLKQAVTLLTKHVLSLSHSHTSLYSSLTFSCETLNNKFKQSTRTLTSHIDSLEKSSRKMNEDVEEVKKRLEANITDLKGDLYMKIDTEITKRDQVLTSLHEQIQEIAGKVIGLQNVVSTFTTDLKASINSIKSATRYEIEEFLLKPEFESMRDDISSVSFAYKKVEKQLNAKVDALEEYQRTTIQAKLEKVDKAVEATMLNISETKDMSENYMEKVTEVINTAIHPLATELTSLRSLTNTHISDFLPNRLITLQRELEEFALSASTKHEGVLTKVEEIVGKQAKLLSEETDRVDKRLSALVEEKERELLSEQYASLSSLETKLIQLQETYVESQVRDIRQKLQWLPINLTDLKGMSPTEARLYMVEARLRSEENRRIQAVEKVYEKMNEMKTSHSRSRRLRTADWQRVSLSDTLQTPSTIGNTTMDRDLRTVFSPGGMPAVQSRRHRRTQNMRNGLSIQSVTMPLVSPFDSITVNTSQKEMLSIYKDFSPAVYSGKSASRACEPRSVDSERRGNTPKPLGKHHRVSISSVISPESAKSLPSSREASPVRYVTMQQNEAVQFEGITEEV